MKKIKGALVLTTINDAVILNNYVDNFSSFRHLEDVEIIVIPDKKTPSATFLRCRELAKKGINVACPTLLEQESFLSKLGLNPSWIPYNSDNRRNIGYLMALESRVDFIMSIDDDNFCQQEEDFFAGHSIVCQEMTSQKIVEDDSGWFNICSMLELDNSGFTYPRGFPYYARHKKTSQKESILQVKIAVNAGLWLIDPDVDGISWMVNPVHVKAFKGESLVLHANTWSPVNTQNTGLMRDAIGSYYYVKMGYPLAGMPIDRYGDIFSGYFVQACARHLGAYIRFGDPIAQHMRNSHNYLNDAANEFAGVLVLEDLLKWLTTEAKLEGKTYVDTFISLSHRIEEAVESFNGLIWNDATRGYFHQMAYSMRVWAKACKTIGIS